MELIENLYSFFLEINEDDIFIMIIAFAIAIAIKVFVKYKYSHRQQLEYEKTIARNSLNYTFQSPSNILFEKFFNSAFGFILFTAMLAIIVFLLYYSSLIWFPEV